MIVEADPYWSRIRGDRYIDTSVVAGFLFQTDNPEKDSWLEMTENGKRPYRILIDIEQNFSMFIVPVFLDEQWKTSGDLYLRFVRKVPVTTKRCTGYIDAPDRPIARPVPHRPIPRPATYGPFEYGPVPLSSGPPAPAPRGRSSLSRIPSNKSNSSSLEEPPSGAEQQRRRKKKLSETMQENNYPLAQAIGLVDAVIENENDLPDMSMGTSATNTPEATPAEIRVHPPPDPDNRATNKRGIEEVS